MIKTGNSALDTLLTVGGLLTALVGVAAAVWRVVRAGLRFFRRVELFMDDWYGEPARPGVPGRPGVMERVSGIDDRLTRVEHELQPNSGQSLRDAVDLANRRLARLCPDPDHADRAEPPDESSGP
ncbi:hypothetical protein ACFVHS_14750 [Streptomyces sp. NPDC057746]|uniref:hypothetical protein n=1 Tax=Streptomyces sp. NPDC057746 TaxID=3346237 RepID=UPI0036827B7C